MANDASVLNTNKRLIKTIRFEWTQQNSFFFDIHCFISQTTIKQKLPFSKSRFIDQSI